MLLSNPELSGFYRQSCLIFFIIRMGSTWLGLNTMDAFHPFVQCHG